MINKIPKGARILSLLYKVPGLTIDIKGQQVGLIETEKGWQLSIKTLNRSLNDEDIWFKMDWSVDQFFKECEQLTEDKIMILATNVTLNEIKK